MMPDPKDYKLLLILERLVGNFAMKEDDGTWYGHDTNVGDQKEAFGKATVEIKELMKS